MTDETEQTPADDVRAWRYSTWSGQRCTVVAHSVEFHSAHVVFRDREGSVVLAEDNQNVHQLSQVGTLGSATRGIRPEQGTP